MQLTILQAHLQHEVFAAEDIIRPQSGSLFSATNPEGYRATRNWFCRLELRGYIASRNMRANTLHDGLGS